LLGVSTLHSGKRLVGVALEMVPSMCHVMQHAAEEGKAEAASALSSLADMNPNVDKAIFEFAGATSLVLTLTLTIFEYHNSPAPSFIR
jgi:hypothetical protein